MRTLRTARLSLVPWDASLTDDLYRLSSDERVMRYVGDGQPWSRERTVKRSGELQEHWAEHGYGWRAIFEDDVFSGVAALSRLGGLVPGIEESAIEIGWWVDPCAWGRGVATEAALAVRDEAFAEVGAERLAARYLPANLASERVMIKLGMRPWGDVEGKDGFQVRVYVLDRTSWQEARRPGSQV